MAHLVRLHQVNQRPNVFIPALLFEGAWNAEIDRLEADWLPIVLLALPARHWRWLDRVTSLMPGR